MTRDEEIKAAKASRAAHEKARRTAKCEVCGQDNEHDPYSGFWCSACGQQHAYDECISVVLTDEQLELLRRDAAARGGR